VASNKIIDKSKLKRSALAIAVALSLSACSDKASTSPDDIALKAISPTILDGYIRDALVCFDTDADGLCSGENSEYVGTTDVNGKVTFNAPVDYATKYPLIAEFTLASFDVGRNQATGLGGYSAPVGKTEFLTPLTTLVHKEKLKDPTISDDEAIDNVKTLLQIGPADDVDLFKDHIAEAEKGDDAYKKLAFKAELAHDVLDQMEEAVEKVQEIIGERDGGLTDSEALQLAFNQLENQLRTLMESLQAEIEAAGDDGLDALVVQTTVTSEPLNFPTAEELENELEEVKSAELFAEANIVQAKSILTAGIYGFYFREYEKISLSADGKELLFDYYNYTDSGQWTKEIDDGSSYEHETTNLCLGDAGWEQDTNTVGDPVTFNSDNTATLDEGCDKYDIKISEVNLAGKSWGQVIYGGYSSEDKLPDTLAQKTFLSGATGYLVEFKQAQDRYSLYGHTCDDSGVNCNFIRKPGTDEPATAFSDIFVSVSDVETGATVSIYNNSGVMSMISVLEGDTATAGKAKIIEMGMVKAEIDWEIKTINTVEIMSFSNIPAEFDDKDQSPFVTVQDGILRVGQLSAADSDFEVEYREVMLNKNALDQILNDSDLQVELTNSFDGSSSSDGANSSDFALTSSDVAKQVFVSADGNATAFFADGTGIIYHPTADDGTPNVHTSDFGWAITSTGLLDIQYSDSSSEQITSHGISGNSLVISSSDGWTDEILVPLPLSTNLLAGKTLIFDTSDDLDCTSRSVVFTSTTASMTEVCSGVESNHALSIENDSTLDNVVIIRGTDPERGAYMMKIILLEGNLDASGRYGFLHFNANGDLDDIRSEKFSNSSL